MGVLVLKQRSTRVEVVDTAAVTVVLAFATALTLLFVVVVAGNVGQEVVGPSNELLAKEHHKGVDGSLLGQLGQFVDELAETSGLLLASARNEDHVALHVASGLVVLAVGHLPAEVRDKQRGVDNPADNVVVKLGGGESTVAALVSQHPETSSEKTLHEGIQAPESEADWIRGNILGRHKVVEDIEGGSQAGDVTEDIAKTKQAVALKAVLGDGIPNVLDSVVGNLERVAVGVHQLSVRDLAGGSGVERGHGGKGSRRSRSSRRVEGRRRGGRRTRIRIGSGRGDGSPQGWVALGRNCCRSHTVGEVCSLVMELKRRKDTLPDRSGRAKRYV